MAKAIAVALILVLAALLIVAVVFAGWLGVAGWLVFTATFYLWMSWDTYQKSKKGPK